MGGSARKGVATQRGGASLWNPRQRGRRCEGNESRAGREAFAAQLVPVGEDGGGWGGVPGAASTLVHPAVAENFRPGCQRGDHTVCFVN